MASVLLPVSKNIWGFDPRSIAGCIIWIDAADTNRFTLNGNNVVTAVQDKSVLNNTMVTTTTGATTAGYQWSATNFNSAYPAFFTNSALQACNIGATASIPTYGVPLTTFVVAKYSGLSSSGNSFLYDSPNRIAMNGPITANGVSNGISVGTSASVSITQQFPTGTYPSSPFINCGFYNGASSSIYTNGTIQPLNNGAGTTGTLGTGITFGTGSICIGSRITNISAWWGSIAEVLFYNNALSNAERQQVEGYLAWKWGLQTSLPSTHPYAPTYSIVRPFLRQFVPNDASTGCLFWFDGKDSSSVILSGSNVTTWRDKSGNANNFTFSGNFPSYNASTGFLGMIGAGNYGTATTPITLSSPTASTIFTVAVPTFPNNVGTYYSLTFRSGPSAPNFYHAACARHSLNGYYIERNPNGAYQFIGQASFSASAISSNGTSVSYTTNTGIPADTLTTGSSIAITSTPGLTSTMSISAISGNGSTVTVTFATSHPFSVGQNISISGVSFNGYNTVNAGGTALNNAILTVVASVPNSTSITYANTSTTAASGGTVIGTYDGVYATSSYNSGTGVVTYPNTLTATSAASLTITGASGNGTLATVTFTNPVAGTPILFAAGQILSITGMNPSGYNSSNGDSKVISATATSVTYTNGTSAAFVSGGVIRSTITFPQSLNGYTWIESSTRIDATNLIFSTSGNTSLGTSPSNSNTGTHTFSMNSSITVNIGEIIMYDGALSTQDRQRLECYLLWKWGNQRVTQSGSYTTVSTTHPFYNFQTATITPFDPRILGNLYMWYDGADASTITGSPMTAWTDKSGNNNNLTTSDGPTRTAVSTNPVGYDIVFNGSSNFMWTTSLGTAISSTTFTYFTVFINNDPSTGYGRIVSAGTTSDSLAGDTSGFFINNDGATTVAPFKLYSGKGAVTTNQPLTKGSYHIVSLVFTSTPLATAFYDGTQVGTFTPASATFNFTKFSLGRNISTGNPLTGVINESIAFTSAFTTTQRQQMEGHLAWKWGINSSLPTTHPYYKVRP
jgi:hypothetical protein